ncbi:MAG: Hsp20/alpha crystallin family protein [Candidatus Nanoarchaeia archaeon]
MRNPWSELLRMQEEMDALFDTNAFTGEKPLLSGPTTSVENYKRRAVTDMYETADTIIVSSELPGMKKEDIHIDVHDNAVEISVEQEKEDKEENDKVYRYERSCKGFYRKLPLPDYADAKKAKASYTNGVLEIKIPKKTEKIQEKKRIAIE